MLRMNNAFSMVPDRLRHDLNSNISASRTTTLDHSLTELISNSLESPKQILWAKEGRKKARRTKIKQQGKGTGLKPPYPKCSLKSLHGETTQCSPGNTGRGVTNRVGPSNRSYGRLLPSTDPMSQLFKVILHSFSRALLITIKL